MNNWITDWSEIDGSERYFVCAINQDRNGRLYLSCDARISLGWQVQRLMKGCYAALPVPAFDPAAHGLKAAAQKLAYLEDVRVNCR